MNRLIPILGIAFVAAVLGIQSASASVCPIDKVGPLATTAIEDLKLGDSQSVEESLNNILELVKLAEEEEGD